MTLINKESLLLVMDTLSENADPAVLDWDMALTVIKTAPEADPVRHGHWIEDSLGDCCYKCSECGFVRDAYLLEVETYCPNCGTKMDGEEDEIDRR